MNKLVVYKKNKIMKNILKLLSLSLLFLIVSSFKYNNDVIVWNKDVKLTWNDFKGKISNDKTYESVNIYNENEVNAARSRIAIGLNFQCKNGKANHIVTAEFEKNNSWYDPKYKSDDVLSHEQLHFDIAEVFARKLRSKLSSMKNACDRPSVVAVFQTNDREFDEFAIQYDIETSHGTNKKKQIEWVNKIQSLLLTKN